MIAPDASHIRSESDRMLSLLSRHERLNTVRGVLRDAREVQRLLALYSFRSPQRAERLCAELSSRYRPDILALYGSGALSRRQSSSVYLRLEQLLSLLLRVAALRLVRAGALSLSVTQLTQSDAMLLHLLESQNEKNTDRSALPV